MDVGHAVLIIALMFSLAGNGWLWYRWHSYRSTPAGLHSHTGFMERVRVTRDRPNR